MKKEPCSISYLVETKVSRAPEQAVLWDTPHFFEA